MTATYHGSWSGRIARLAVLPVVGVLCAAVGCVLPRDASTRQTPAPKKFFPIGIRYFLEPMLPRTTEQFQEQVTEDFSRFRQWGFNCVVLEQVHDDCLDFLIHEAMDRSLRIIPAPRPLYHFVRFGELPSGTTAINAVLEAYLARIGRHPAVAMHLVPESFDPPSDRRAGLVEQLLGEMDPAHNILRLRMLPAPRSSPGRPDVPDAEAGRQSWPTSGPSSPEERWLASYVAGLRQQLTDTPVGRRVLLLPTSGPWLSNQVDPEWWVHLYHECLAAGWTDGVIFERYRTLPTGSGGLLDENRTVTTRQAAVVKRLTADIAEWGPRLLGMEVVARSPASDPSSIVSTYFSNGRRRLLLLCNRRHSTFARESVQVLSDIETQPITRAVDLGTGERYLRRGTHLEIPLRLRPAQACLYELF